MSFKSTFPFVRKLGANSWNWPVKITGSDENSYFDLEYDGSYRVPPCRVWMKRAGDHWQIARIDPHFKAKPKVKRTAKELS